MFFNEVLDELKSAIDWCVINDDYLVIGVVLVVDWLQVVLISEILAVVDGGNDYAEGLLG
jgi:hypothetical protein